MTKLIFHKNHLETVNQYVCSRGQAAAILKRGSKKRTYVQDTPLAGDTCHCDLTSKSIERTKKGILIGCTLFSKSDISLVRRWLRGLKVENQ